MLDSDGRIQPESRRFQQFLLSMGSPSEHQHVSAFVTPTEILVAETWQAHVFIFNV